MSSWGRNDNAANSPLWGTMTVNKAPTSANQSLLFANNVANAFTTGLTIGVYGVDSNEASAQLNNGVHTGWVRRSVGQGGRAGRVFNEVLVAMSTVAGDFEDNIMVDATIVITTPVPNVSATSGAGTFAFVAVGATTQPPSAAAGLTYNWQFNTSTGALGWTNCSGNTSFLNATTANMRFSTVTANANTWRVRCVISVPSGNNYTTPNAIITVV